jgi:DNA-binding response OmpR family regulator
VAASDPDWARGGETILIVDDTPANLDVLVRTLEPLGYRILAAPTGEIALSVAQKNLPDLVLMDVVLPDTDGYETCRRLHAQEATLETPVLFISALNETGSLVEAFRAGGLDYITKPIDPDVVIIRVETHLRVSRLAKQLREKNAALTAANQQLRAEMDRRTRAEDALKVADEKLSSLTQQEAQRWGLSAFVGQSKTFENSPAAEFQRRQCPHHRRKRDRKRAGRPRRALWQRAIERSVHPGELRGDPCGAGRIDALWSRARRVHRRDGRSQGLFRTGRWRHVISR